MSRKRAVMEAEILRVAAEVFSEKGYRTATLDDLAAAAGISRATFYSYFPSKEELLCRLYRQFASATHAEVQKIIAQDLPVQEKLRRIVRFMVTYVATHTALVQVFFSEVLNLPAKMSHTVKQTDSEYHRTIERVVEEGVREGVLAPFDPRLLTYGLMGMCTWVYRWYRPQHTTPTPDTIADTFISLLERGYLSAEGERSTDPVLREVQEVRHIVEQLHTLVAPQKVNGQGKGAESTTEPPSTGE